MEESEPDSTIETPEREDCCEFRYPVQGAGELVIGAGDSLNRTGTAVGISVAVTWGEYPEAPGVMDVGTVEELHEMLGQWLNGWKDSIPAIKVANKRRSNELKRQFNA